MASIGAGNVWLVYSGSGDAVVWSVTMVLKAGPGVCLVNRAGTGGWIHGPTGYDRNCYEVWLQ